MATLSRRRVAETIAERLLSGEPPKQTMQQLAAYLITHRLQSEAEHYVADIERLLAEKQIVVADVTTARPLDDEMRREIIKAIDATQVTLREHVDPDMIGGIVIKTPESELDASVRTTLRRLRTT